MAISGIVPSRWYLLAQSIHFLLYQGWSLLYTGQVPLSSLKDLQRSADDSGDLQRPDCEAACLCDLTAPEDIFGALVCLDDSSAGGEALLQEAETSSAAAMLATNPADDDAAVRRAQRVRARKAGQWILDPKKMICGISLALVALSPTERHLYHLLKCQSTESWKGTLGISAVPLVQFSQPFKSPSSRALEEYAVLQRLPFDASCPFLRGLVQGPI